MADGQGHGENRLGAARLLALHDDLHTIDENGSEHHQDGSAKYGIGDDREHCGELRAKSHQKNDDASARNGVSGEHLRDAHEADVGRSRNGRDGVENAGEHARHCLGQHRLARLLQGGGPIGGGVDRSRMSYRESRQHRKPRRASSRDRRQWETRFPRREAAGRQSMRPRSPTRSRPCPGKC